MTYRTIQGIVMFGVMELALVGGAHAKPNPLQCGAKTLHCGSRYYHCLARCDHQAAAQRSKPADIVEAQHDKCETGCFDRYIDRLEVIQANPPCADRDVADPHLCESRYLQIQADDMACQARCAIRADAARCVKTCTTREGTAFDRLRADPVCAEGKDNAPVHF